MSSETEPSSPISPSSLKQKLKSSLRLPWLRHHNHHHHHQQQQQQSLTTSTTPLSTPSASPKPFKDKCRDLINRIGHGPAGGGHRRSHSHGQGNHHGNGHGRRHSTDFRYDPSSYALNFDEGSDDSRLDEFPNRNFTARLPPSPTATTSREITAYT